MSIKNCLRPCVFGLAILINWHSRAEFVWTTNLDNTVTITGYTPRAGCVELVIPDLITGLPVTGIGDYAFSGGTNILSVLISTNVTFIGAFAFTGCLSQLIS